MKKLTLLLSLFILVSCVKDTEKELTIFNRQIKPIRNRNIRYILFLLILIIGYFV